MLNIQKKIENLWLSNYYSQLSIRDGIVYFLSTLSLQIPILSPSQNIGHFGPTDHMILTSFGQNRVIF